MKLTVLVENTPGCGAEGAHGLSLYIETAHHKILFDAGPKGELLLQNAAALGVDLSAVDIAVLSHAHYDHAGGLLAFLGVNSKARVYLREGAFCGHFATENVGWRDIGPDAALLERFAERLVFTGERFPIDDELELFADIATADYLSAAAGDLYEKNGDAYERDRFLHEQNLLIHEQGRHIMVGGCAHRGVVNILRRCEAILGEAPAALVSGFHLTNPGKGIDEPGELVRAVGAELAGRDTRYYTGHCTGHGPFALLKEQLGDQLHALSTGAVFDI